MKRHALDLTSNPRRARRERLLLVRRRRLRRERPRAVSTRRPPPATDSLDNPRANRSTSSSAYPFAKRSLNSSSASHAADDAYDVDARPSPASPPSSLALARVPRAPARITARASAPPIDTDPRHRRRSSRASIPRSPRPASKFLVEPPARARLARDRASARADARALPAARGAASVAATVVEGRILSSSRAHRALTIRFGGNGDRSPSRSVHEPSSVERRASRATRAALFDDDDEHVRDERASDGENRASGAVRGPRTNAREKSARRRAKGRARRDRSRLKFEIQIERLTKTMRSRAERTPRD